MIAEHVHVYFESVPLTVMRNSIHPPELSEWILRNSGKCVKKERKKPFKE